MRFASGIESQRQCQTTSLSKSTKALWSVISDERSLATRTNSMSSLLLKSERTAAISGNSAMQGAQIVEKKSMTRIFPGFAPVGTPWLNEP